MSPHEFFETYRRARSALPFAVDDMPAAAEAFARWQHGDASGRDDAGLWAYLYLLRTFGTRFLSEPQRRVSDLDALLAETYARVMAHGPEQVRDPERFPAWVSVVAQNAFRTYLRRTAPTAALPDSYDAPDDAPLPLDDTDPVADRAHVVAAINRLPDYLRDIASRRLLNQEDYDAIARDLGKDVQVVRTYTKKALDRLRADPALRTLLGFDG
ncbi:MAG: sigma-70 family RNA polymerase sigma factor [Rhodothermales bacterium]|nr:sigma-70 family RNA polymerase sigma factor [Rhodothermales bacterium]MCA0267936.1 sigma-70 family RNA polymerase sigma factor [Bacteroidota bacterium]